MYKYQHLLLIISSVSFFTKSDSILAFMIISNKKDSFFLLVGDLFIFALSLWVSLVIRGGDVSLGNTFIEHLLPFSFIFLAWILVFFIAGLYDKYTNILRESVPEIIFNAQLANSVIAIAFFYLLPYFGIAPKTILFLDLVITFILVYLWRMYHHSVWVIKRKEPAILVGSGEEMCFLLKEINENPKSELQGILSVDLDKEKDISYLQNVINKIKTDGVSVVIVDLKDSRIEPILPTLYHQIFKGVKFIDMDKVYESIFDRVPLSFLQYEWFLENVSVDKKTSYDFLKRFMDIVIGSIAGMISLVIYPFILILLLCDEGHGFFSIQDRIGKNNKLIKMYKFRTMKIANDGGKWGIGEKNYVTKIGAFLRKTRLDELPQLWNVVIGDISLIGPRPEFPLAVKTYEQEISYYDIRHLIKPGLSGWAQLYHDNHPHHGIGIDETKEKLSYDLYYLKNRSFMLDVKIVLKTIKKLLSIKGK